MTMRVLQVIGAMDRGGAETMIMNLYRAMDRSAIQFDFLVQATDECDFDREIYELGGNIYRVPRYIGANYFPYKRACRAFFSEHGGDYPVVHGHIGSSAAVYLSEAKRVGCKTIAHSHAQKFLRFPLGPVFDVLSYPTRYVADYFLGCSREAGVDRFGEAVVESEQFSVLNNGIDLSAYRPHAEKITQLKQELGLDQHFVVGHVGRFAPEKNHEFLLHTFAEVCRMRPNAVLLLVGRGPLESTLRAEVEKLGLSDRVRFLGVRDDVPDILSVFDVMAFPSVKEGLGLVAIEAQAAGLPVVMSTGLPSTACILPNAKMLDLAAGEHKWAEALLRAASHQVPFEQAAKEIRTAGFDIHQSAQELTQLYETLAAQSR